MAMHPLQWLVPSLLGCLASVAVLQAPAQAGPLDPPAAPAPTDAVRIPGTPVSGPMTISTPGHYYLTRNITVSGQTAITISAGGVSLDLGGFTVSGNDAAGSYGVLISGEQLDISISDGTVRDFNIGVYAGLARRVSITNVKSNSNVRGFEIGAYSQLTGCLAIDNSETSIYVPGTSSAIRDCFVGGLTTTGVSTAGNYNLVERSNVPSIVDTGVIYNTFRDNVVGSITLKLNGAAYVVGNVCRGSGISNPGGNSVGTNYFC